MVLFLMDVEELSIVDRVLVFAIMEFVVLQKLAFL